MGAAASALAVALTASPFPVWSQAFQQASIKRIVDGNQVFIDGQQARVNDVARSGQQIRTGRSRAEVLFDRRSTAFLARSSVVTLGSNCFRISNGAILVTGPQKACLGSKVLGVKGTTYAVSVDPSGYFDVIFFEGEGHVGDVDGFEEQADASRQQGRRPPGGATSDPTGNTTYICQCEIARFTLDGQFVSQGRASQQQFAQLLRRHTSGQGSLPSSQAVQAAFNKCYGGA